MSRRHQRLLRIAFAAIWIAGLAGYLAAPVARLYINRPNTGSLYGDLLLAVHPNNNLFHPFFYEPMKAAVDALLARLSPDEQIVYVVVNGDEQHEPERQRLRRNLSVWLYPRHAEWPCGSALNDAIEACAIPPDAPLATWRLDEVPGYSCEWVGAELRLCR